MGDVQSHTVKDSERTQDTLSCDRVLSNVPRLPVVLLLMNKNYILLLFIIINYYYNNERLPVVLFYFRILDTTRPEDSEFFRRVPPTSE